MGSNLSLFRKKIDAVDAQIIKLLARRMKLVEKVGKLKKEQGIAPFDKNRWQKVLESRLLFAKELGLDKRMIQDIYERIHETALILESNVKEDA